jgi:hypothetical protein
MEKIKYNRPELKSLTDEIGQVYGAPCAPGRADLRTCMLGSGILASCARGSLYIAPCIAGKSV